MTGPDMTGPDMTGPDMTGPAASDPARAAEGDAPASGAGAVATDADWSRLSPLVVAVAAAWTVGIVGVTAVILLFTGVPAVWVLPFVPPPIAVAVGWSYLHWHRTCYRLTDERLEVRSGILVRSAKSVPRDRIRSVDVTADIVYRIFGLAGAKVGTGESTHGGGSSGLSLDPLSATDAERLRVELLRRGGRPTAVTTMSAPGTPAEAPPVEAPPGEDTAAYAEPAVAEGEGSVELARLDWRWLRYAPFGVLTPLLSAAAIGAIFQVAGWFDRLPWQLEPVRPVVDVFLGAILPLGVLLLAVAFLLAGAIGATAIWVETWWNYRLEHGSGVFRVRRGLLTSRSISFEEARLRGIEVAEPLPLRRHGVGQPSVVATGMETSSERQKGNTVRRTLMPPATLPDVHPVVARVLGEGASPMDGARLVPHPRAALRRRLLWGLGAVTVAAIALLVLGLLLTDVLLWLALAVAIVGYAVVAPLALDAYRNLGHGVRGRFLLSRHGTVSRRTVMLQRSGVIGWKVRQSFFQRRAGIATVTATTAAGNGKYAVYDAELGEGLEWADEAVPDLLAPFLTRPRP